MRQHNRVIAIFCADIHLQHNPPVCRHGEPDWYDAMSRPLSQLRAIAEKYDAPIFCAGDVFDHWKSCPELINWAIKHLPKMYAIPGQHDLPQHRLEDVRKSAYWTLVEAGIIENLPSVPLDFGIGGKLFVHAFPWGTEICNTGRKKGRINVALAHRYCWIAGHSYGNAPPDQRLSSQAKELNDFDVVVFGDNHSGFLAQIGTKTTIFNCGTLMRRKSDEDIYRPQIGLLYEDGVIIPHHLDISEDELDSSKKEVSENVNLEVKDFLDQLNHLGETSLDFKVVLEGYISDNRVDSGTKKVLIEALEGDPK